MQLVIKFPGGETDSTFYRTFKKHEGRLTCNIHMYIHGRLIKYVHIVCTVNYNDNIINIKMYNTSLIDLIYMNYQINIKNYFSNNIIVFITSFIACTSAIISLSAQPI